jgi:hypothetical protein
MKLNSCQDLSIEECLEDAGCSCQTIESVLECIEEENDERKIMLLKKHRCYLLDKIHDYQKQIDCLDYLLYQFKQEEHKS